MDEGDGLENRYTGNCIVGSNPTPSAKNELYYWTKVKEVKPTETTDSSQRNLRHECR